jgi:hypothetical protein
MIPELQNITEINIQGKNKKLSSLPKNLISNETCFYKYVSKLTFIYTTLNLIKSSDLICLSKLKYLEFESKFNYKYRGK